MNEQIQILESSISDLKIQHSQIIRSSHTRQIELEHTNVELTASLTDKIRDLNRLQRLLEGNTQDMNIIREVDGLRQQVTMLNNEIENEQIKCNNTEIKLRSIDCEFRAAQNLWDEEKRRAGNEIENLKTNIIGKIKIMIYFILNFCFINILYA